MPRQNNFWEIPVNSRRFDHSPSKTFEHVHEMGRRGFVINDKDLNILSNRIESFFRFFLSRELRVVAFTIARKLELPDRRDRVIERFLSRSNDISRSREIGVCNVAAGREHPGTRSQQEDISWSRAEDASGAGIPYQGARFPDLLPPPLGPLPSQERILTGATPLRGHDKHRERKRESFETRALVMATSAHSSAIVLEFLDATPPPPPSTPRIDKIHSRLCGTGHQMENQRTWTNQVSTLRELVSPRSPFSIFSILKQI